LAAPVEAPLLLLLVLLSPTAGFPFVDANSLSPPCHGKVWLSCYRVPGAQSAFLLLASIPSLLTERRSVHVAWKPQIKQVRWDSAFMGSTALRMRSELHKPHGSPRQFLPDLTPCGRPLLATMRCSAFATDG